MGGAHIRLRDDFDKGHPAAVQVHQAAGKALRVDELAGVLLDVDAGNADALGVPLLVHHGVDVAVLAEGDIKLGNLVGLGQVGVEIVLPVRLADGVDGAVCGVAHADGVLHHLFVEGGEAPRHPGAVGAAVGVHLRAEGVLAAAIDFGFGGKLGVDLQANNGDIFHPSPPPFRLKPRRCKDCRPGAAGRRRRRQRAAPPKSGGQ